MTADYFPFPHEILGRAATHIINEVRGIDGVVYDVTSKTPRHDRVGVRGPAVAPYSAGRLRSIRAKTCSSFAKNPCHPPLAPS